MYRTLTLSVLLIFITDVFATIPKYNITFRVDMTNSDCEGSYDSVTVAGNKLPGAWGSGTTMSQVGTSKVYSVTLQIDSGEVEFKFRYHKGGNTNWESFANRKMTFKSDSTIALHCFNTTSACVPKPPPSTIIFRLDLSNQMPDPQGRIYVMGNFLSRNAEVLRMYPVAGPPGIFEVTVNNVCYSSFNYIFINGDSSQTYGNETYPDTTSRTCLEPDGLGGFNRKYTRIDTNAVVLGFVYNKCDTIICGNFANATPAGPTALCQGGSVVLNANTGIGLTYQWLNNNTPIALATNNAFTANTSGSYRVIITNSSSCRDTSAAVNVTISPPPTATAVAATATNFCQGGSVVISANTGTGLTYQWLNNNAPIALATNSSLTANSSGSYRVMVTNASNCRDTSAAVSVTVHPLPVAIATAATATTFCQGGSVLINANTGIGLTYQWRNTGVNIPLATTSSFTASTSGSYDVAVTNNNGCIDSSSLVNVTVNPYPIAGVMLGDSLNLKIGNFYIYTLAQQPNHTYNWIVSKGIIVGGQNTNTATVQWSTNGSGFIRSIISNPQGCTDTSSKQVSIGNVGLNKLSTLRAFHVYPNPSNGSFTISMQAENATAVEMRLVNLLGQTVWSQSSTLQAGENELTVNAPLAPGMYTLIVDENNNRLQQKIIIK